MASQVSHFSDHAYSTTPALSPLPPPGHPRRRSSEADTIRSIRHTSLCNDDPPRRNSAFLEVGLGGDDAIVDAKLRRDSRPKLQVCFRSKIDIVQPKTIDWDDSPRSTKNYSHAEMPLFFPTLPRLLFLALVIVLVIPSLHTSPLKVDANPVRASRGDIERVRIIERGLLPPMAKRDDSPTVVCKRWSQQSAVVNGTLYLYGGRAITSSDQTSNTWSMLSHFESVISG